MGFHGNKKGDGLIGITESDLRISKGRHQRWITFALKQAKKSKMDSYKHCAVLIKSGRVISTGLNNNKAGRLIDEVYDLCGFHAEAAVLCNLEEEMIRNAELYVCGWSKGGKIIKSKPCIKCQEYLKKFELKAVYYGIEDGGYERYEI